jgi:hypothetical protein
VVSTLYGAAGSKINVRPRNGQQYGLDELQGFVAGLIEIVPLNEELLMVVNETGKLDGLPVNIEATKIWMRHYGPTDIIMGNALVCSLDEIA